MNATIPNHHLRIASVLLLGAAAAAPGHAITVTNLSTSSVLFEETFESGLAPAVGLWSRVGPSVAVTTSTAPPEPGPAQGATYLRLYRDSVNIPSQGEVQARLSQPQASTGDRIQLEAMVYVPDDGVNARIQVLLSDGEYTSARAWVRPDGLGNVIAVGSGLTLTDTGIDYTPGLWQRWSVSYEIGSATFSVSVAGVGASGFASFSTGGVSHANFWNGSAVPGAAYLDAVPVPVPEPASLALLASGLGLLAVGARRRQAGSASALKSLSPSAKELS